MPMHNLIEYTNFKTKIAGRIENDGTRNVKIIVPIKYLSNFG